MQESMDALVNDLKPEELVNTRRYLEMVEMSKRVTMSNDDEISLYASGNEFNSDDEAFIDDRDMPPLIEDSDDDDDIQWVSAELERRLLDDTDEERDVLVSLICVV